MLFDALRSRNALRRLNDRIRAASSAAASPARSNSSCCRTSRAEKRREIDENR